MDNIYHVSEYVNEIQNLMLKNEHKWEVDSTYMANQTKINETIRSTLIDWIIQIHYNFKLLPESLFLTVNIIDRYFEKETVSKKEVQLVGITAMLIATKYEEIYPPLLKDFVFITDNSYTAEDVLQMEIRILAALDFNLQLTSPYRFLERFAKCAGVDKVTFALSQYMLELGLLDSKMNQFSASLQAISAIYTARKYLRYYNHSKSSDEIATILPEYQLTNSYSPSMVKSCARCFNQLAILI